MKESISLKDRLKKNFSENKVLLFVFIVIWAVVLYLTLNFYSNTFGKESYGPTVLEEVVEVDKNTNIKQIVSTDGNTETVSVKFATYARKNKGNITLKVTGLNSRNVYLEKQIPISRITDNQYATYSLNKEVNSTYEKQIAIELTSDSEQGSSVGVYVSNYPCFEYSNLTINGGKIDKELGIKFLLENENYQKFTKLAIYFTCILLTTLVIVLLLINPSQEVMLTILAAAFGLTLLLVITPGAAPDELLHYEETLQVSNAMMFEDTETIDKAYLNYDSFGDHVNSAYSYNRFIRDINKPFELKDKKEEFTYSATGYLAYYVPQAIGVTIARLLKVNTLKTFYIGRLTNLIFYLACVYISLKNTPTKKMLLGVIANIPIFIQQAASYSYDAFINGLVLILISFFFKWYFVEEKINKKDYIFVLITCILLAPAKIVYGVFILLFWFVPFDRYQSKKHKTIGTLLLCAPTIVFVLYNIIIRTIGTLLDGIYYEYLRENCLISTDISTLQGYVGDDDWQLYNIHFILRHPIWTIKICLRSVRFYLSTWFYQSIGRSLAGSNLVMPMTIVRLIMICLAITSFREEKYTLSNGLRIAFIGACIVIALLILFTMLTGWTERGDVLIKGVQGRYFCPLLPYFFSIFGNKKFKLPSKLDKYVLFALIIVNFETVIYILSYTFVN